MKKTFIAAALVALASTATMAQGNKFDYTSIVLPTFRYCVIKCLDLPTFL